jgi:hypothetical protein
MHTRLIRMLLVVVGIAIGLTAGYFLKNTDTEINTERAAADTLRGQAAALKATIADLRAGQFAYVARGQGEAFWMSQVAGLLPALQEQTAGFQALLTSPQAQSAFEPAIAALENFRTLDSRVKDFVSGGNPLLAADLIFSDGLESTATASMQVTAALNEELRARLDRIAALRTRQIASLGGAAGALFLLMVCLALAGGAAQASGQPDVAAPAVEPVRFEAPLPRAKAAVTPRLVSTAQLCGELARVMESKELPSLLERAAKVLDASGIIVWVAEPSRQSMLPAMSHGYDDKAVARMGSIHRDANNAAAAAFRTSEIRTVGGDAFTSGAVIVPLLTTEGCVGVLSAEMKGGSEKDESSQALASIFAAQLAMLVATPAALPLKAAARA